MVAMNDPTQLFIGPVQPLDLAQPWQFAGWHQAIMGDPQAVRL